MDEELRESSVTPVRALRLFVSGGSDLTAPAAAFWQALGRRLARVDGLTIITGGLKARHDKADSLTADWKVVEGLREALPKGDSESERITTMLPDPERDVNGIRRFRAGHVLTLVGRNAQSRRFRMVHSADVVCSIEGAVGTRSVLDVALAIERPILPFPFAGGMSQEVWFEQRPDIIRWFGLTDGEVKRFECASLSMPSDADLADLADLAVTCLLRGFTQACFIIMQIHPETQPVYKDAIVPGLASHGYAPWRTDQALPAGDIHAAIRDGIAFCKFAIADITGDRPNVMYELGLAHAANKPVIVIRGAGDSSLPDVPFDLQPQKVIWYPPDLRGLRDKLEGAIGALASR